MESFKYLGLHIPSSYNGNECATWHFDVRKRIYNAFENTCNGGEIKCWVLKKYLFNTLMTLVFFYGVVPRGGIPKSMWKEFENVQKLFLTKLLQVKKQT